MSKKDNIDKLYQPSKLLEKTYTGLFCANIFISLIAVYYSKNEIISTLLIVIALLYTILSVADDCLFWFSAEDARRKNCIQEAFKVRLDVYETQEYYNNDINDPELSYAVNLFESIFFTKTIAKKMLFTSIIKALVALAALIVSCVLVKNFEVLLIIVQTVFSSIVIEDTIRLLFFVQRVNTLFDEAYHEFITVGIKTHEQKVWLRYFCVEYESIKAHYRVRLSEPLFRKLNSQLSAEWENMLKQINILQDI